MSIRRVADGLRRFWRWAWSSEPSTTTVCPVCRRPIKVMNFTGGSAAFGIPVMRTVDELVTTCEEQHGVTHAAADVDAAKVERLWR